MVWLIIEKNLNFFYILFSSKYFRVLEIPSFSDIFGFHPNDLIFKLLTTKFPTSTFFVYFGGFADKFTLQSV